MLNGKRGVAWFGLLHAILLTFSVASLVQEISLGVGVLGKVYQRRPSDALQIRVPSRCLGLR